MQEMIKLFLAVLMFSIVSGGLLAGVKMGTAERIEMQQLKFVKGPAIKQIFEDAANDPLSDRFKIEENGTVMDFFIAHRKEKGNAVAFETTAQGFGGELGVVVGVDVETDEIVGVVVTTHSETPGVGSRAKDEPTFTSQFVGMSLDGTFHLKADNGKVDAISGATITSRGVCGAVSKASQIYNRLKDDIKKNI